MNNIENHLKNFILLSSQENLSTGQASSGSLYPISSNNSYLGNANGHSLPILSNMYNGLNMNISGGLNLSATLQYQNLLRNLQIYEILKKQGDLALLNQAAVHNSQILQDFKNNEISNIVIPSTNISENKIKIEEKHQDEVQPTLLNQKFDQSKKSHTSKSAQENGDYSDALELSKCHTKLDEASIKKIKCQFMTQKDDLPIEKPKYFKCRHCDKIFPKESNLVDHLRTHTGEKPFKCSFENCGKNFSQLGNLKKHESVHFGEKAFYCEFEGCGKGFSAMYNLKIHQRSHSGEKPYKCTIEGCGRDFYDKGNLKYHEKTSHSYELKSNPFSCDHIGCNLKFKTRKQKLIHHHNLEPECKEEKQSIIKTLALFKKFILAFVRKDPEKFKNDKDFIDLKSSYEELEKKLLDPDFFFLTVGENFDETPNY